MPKTVENNSIITRKALWLHLLYRL